jgi:hypothetical protein
MMDHTSYFVILAPLQNIYHCFVGFAAPSLDKFLQCIVLGVLVTQLARLDREKRSASHMYSMMLMIKRYVYIK